ncbi:MAG: hypothetical protein R3C02_16535 [Planctomycetaceae bacterium]
MNTLLRSRFTVGHEPKGCVVPVCGMGLGAIAALRHAEPATVNAAPANERARRDGIAASPGKAKHVIFLFQAGALSDRSVRSQTPPQGTARHPAAERFAKGSG